jgi:hypothetical protein
MLEYLKREKRRSNHHREFNIACCLAKLQQYKDSARHVQLAAALYRKDGRPWALDCARLADQLLTSLRDGSVVDLLAQWTEHSIAQLRLRTLIRSPDQAA